MSQDAGHKVDVACRYDRSVAGTGLESHLVESLLELGVQDFQQISSLTFDFTTIEYIDSVSLQMLIAYVLTCDKYDVHVGIEFPESKYWRDQFRAWGFDCAISLATTRNLHWFATDESRKRYFSDDDRQSSFDLSVLPNGEVHPDVFGSKYNGIFQRKFGHLKPDQIPRGENFFAFHSFDASTSDARGMAIREKNDWQNPNVARFIERRVGVDVNYLSSRIIFEALFNALRHPNAEIVQTATFFSRAKKKSAPKELALSENPFEDSKSATTHFWDDGAPMLLAYNKKLSDIGSPIRLTKDPDYLCSYRVQILGGDNAGEFRINSDEDIGIDCPEWKKLISLTFPEVSSALERDDHDVAEETKREEDVRLTAKGMGLYLMLHAATKVQTGTLTIRTGNMRARFRKNKYKEIRKSDAYLHDYNVEIKVYSDVIPDFKGNLVIIGMLPE